MLHWGEFPPDEQYHAIFNLPLIHVVLNPKLRECGSACLCVVRVCVPEWAVA